jgi:hypothetical protein
MACVTPELLSFHVCNELCKIDLEEIYNFCYGTVLVEHKATTWWQCRIFFSFRIYIGGGCHSHQFGKNTTDL